MKQQVLPGDLVRPFRIGQNVGHDARIQTVGWEINSKISCLFPRFEYPENKCFVKIKETITKNQSTLLEEWEVEYLKKETN